MKIFAFHLLNDYSGSPKVLMQLVKGWVNEGIETTVVTGAGRNGFLSNLTGVRYKYFTYEFASNPWIRLFRLVYSQLRLFISLYRVVTKQDIIYINTVLPFGAALLGKVKGCRIIYHIHETSMKPAMLKKFLFGIAQWAAQDVIYVSHYQAFLEKTSFRKVHVLYNAIENTFLDQAKVNRIQSNVARHILMVCSLKEYKGVHEFVSLAELHSTSLFKLVVNADEGVIKKFFEHRNLPANLTLHATQTNLHPFYSWADVIVNLSRPDGWIETFGLTIVEGMAYALPAIVPPVGGITELVTEGVNGFMADSRNISELTAKLTILEQDETTYAYLCKNAAHEINKYSEDVFIQDNLHILKAS